MEFKKVQLIGFKSFIEKTTFLIENGLTGIVGPNGCGKSNIVESVRWCMGETSAKSMRGSGMEDVIFSGTANKPSKNIAEVTITLGNTEKDGPMQFRDIEKIDVKRRIEKTRVLNILLMKKKCVQEMRKHFLQIYLLEHTHLQLLDKEELGHL
jgi:chromosome segregation protein